MDTTKISVLEKLIRELCPEGVEYRTLSELFKTKNGYTPSKGKKEFWENGTIPWFRMDDIRQNGGILSSALQNVTEKAVKGELFPENSLIVATSATIGEHALITVPSLANQRFTYLSLKEEYKNKFEIKFLYYYCFKLDEYCKNNLNQGSFASVDMGKFSKFRFPILPFPIQQEIVRILDTFTNLTTELTDKLNAELTARRKQYEYYRDELLTFGEERDEVVWQPLGEICNVVSGGTPSKKISSYWENGTIKWLGSTVCNNEKTVDEVTKYITLEGLNSSSAKLMPIGTTLIALVGATIGKVAYLPFEAAINQNIAGIYPKDTRVVDSSYLYYACTKLYQEFLSLTQGQKLAMANLSFVRSLKIPVPPMDEQKRIAEVLDKFNAICSDLRVGLPAEITARQKQYEYYRNQLLTFKQIGG